jgi:hypothetical protein
MKIQEIRERINVFLYGSKERVLSGLKLFNLIVSSSALLILAIY